MPKTEIQKGDSNTKELLTRTELLFVISDIIEDNEHKLKNARSPKSKRAAEATKHVFLSIRHHLLNY